VLLFNRYKVGVFQGRKSTICECYYERLVLMFTISPRYVDEAQDNLLIDAMSALKKYGLLLSHYFFFTSSEGVVQESSWTVLGGRHSADDLCW